MAIAAILKYPAPDTTCGMNIFFVNRGVAALNLTFTRKEDRKKEVAGKR
jgi:hypothetical protein